MSRASDAVERLLAIMQRLRAPDGCPWDREQTLASLRPYVLEETYEVLEAIDAGDVAATARSWATCCSRSSSRPSCGEEAGAFEFADVADAISDKLVSRHPHVFGGRPGEGRRGGAEAVGRAQAGGEARRRGAARACWRGCPREMPALARADRLTEKASRVGFDWPDAAGARAKVAEELGELDAAIASGDRARMEHELGDTLFALANLARKLGVAPEEALRGHARPLHRPLHPRGGGLERRGVPPRRGHPGRDGPALGRGEGAGASSEIGALPAQGPGRPAFGESRWISGGSGPAPVEVTRP